MRWSACRVALEVLAGALGVAAFAFVVYAGLAGNQTATANIAPTVVFVLFWVGIPCASVLLGDVFAAFNPWRAVGRACGTLARRVSGADLPTPLAYPERIGRWPAAAGILAFAWVELVDVHRTEPQHLAILMLVYAAVMLVGMSLYGVRAWTAQRRRVRRRLRAVRAARAAALGRRPGCGCARRSPGPCACRRSRAPSPSSSR